MKSRITVLLFICFMSFYCCKSEKNNQSADSHEIEYRTISGIVVDEFGSPLSKAVIYSNVPELEKPDGTITDSEGRFTFNIPKSAKIFIVGYTGKSDIEVTLTMEQTYRITLP